MDFIFLDLEWNNTYSKTHKKFINEIIEIGAVKLDCNFTLTDSIDIIVESQITKKLRGKFKELTGISNQEMQSGISFLNATQKFKDFCGEDFVTVTWSNSDLYTLSENFNSFLGTSATGFIGKYLDLQKFYQSVMHKDGGNQIGLKAAAEQLNIDVNNVQFHRASADSEITALIFNKIRAMGNYEKFIIDTSKNNYFERLAFKPYLIDDINSKYIKKQHFEFHCTYCGKKAKPVSNWVCKNKQFTNIFYCKKCKISFLGRVRIKKTYDDVKVKKTTSGSLVKTAKKEEKVLQEATL